MSLASNPVLDMLVINEVSPNIQFLLFSAYHEWRARYDAVLMDQEFWACRLCRMLNETPRGPFTLTWAGFGQRKYVHFLNTRETRKCT